MIQYPVIVNPTATIVRSIVSSHVVDQEYRLFISLPESYQTSEKTYPVLYLLDGNGLFGLVKPILELQQLMQSIPELIIVGIGYPTETYIETVTLRGRDLTVIELTEEQKAKDNYPFGETGGAANFFAYIRDELIPMIDAEFRTDPTDRILAGFSLSGTFAVYAAFQVATLFKRIIAISPDTEDVVETENLFAQTHSSLPLRLSIGVEHLSERYDRWINQIETFVERIEKRPYAGLKTSLRIFEGIDHSQAGPIGFAYGIKDIFAEEEVKAD